MMFKPTRAIFACTLLIAGIVSTSSWAQVATMNCPKRMAYARNHAPAPTQQYQAVKELEQYVAQLQAEIAKGQHSRPKRARSSR